MSLSDDGLYVPGETVTVGPTEPDEATRGAGPRKAPTRILVVAAVGALLVGAVAVRCSAGRGVTALAPTPTAAGSTLVDPPVVADPATRLGISRSNSKPQHRYLELEVTRTATQDVTITLTVTRRVDRVRRVTVPGPTATVTAVRALPPVVVRVTATRTVRVTRTVHR